MKQVFSEGRSLFILGAVEWCRCDPVLARMIKLHGKSHPADE
jgi:hypothetical protein